MNTDIQEFQTSAISETSNPLHTPTSSPYRSHALVSQLQAMVADLKMRVASSGLRPKGLLALLDPNTWQLKTVQHSIFGDLEKFSGAFPSSGIMRNGRLYLVTNLRFSNAVKGYILLPTPVKADHKAPHGRAHYFGHLRKGRGCHLPVYIRDGEQDGIYPNPELTEVLMTFPAGYTDLQVQEMPSYR